MKKTREQKIRRRFCREFAGDLYFYCLLLTGSAEEAQGIARAVLGAEHTLSLIHILRMEFSVRPVVEIVGPLDQPSLLIIFVVVDIADQNIPV